MLFNILTTLLLATLSAARPIVPRAITGPVFPDNFPDPSIIQVGDTWYAFSTASLNVHIPIAKSAPNDFTSWTLVKNADGSQADALPDAGAWSTGANTWAPNVIQVGSQFVMYYTAQSQQNNPKGSPAQCIGVATSTNIEGPYTPDNSPIACPAEQGGAIDPSGFTDTDGSLYLVYKIDGNAIGNGGSCGNTVAPIVPTPIMLQKLSASGTSTDGSAPVTILDRGDADGPLVEAPSLAFSGGAYFLFFSSGCYVDDSYDASYAVSRSGVAGAYVKSGQPLLVTGTSGLVAPGGLAVAADARSVAFMADESEQTHAGTRQMYVGQVNLDAGNGAVSFA